MTEGRLPNGRPPGAEARELARHLRGERPDYAYLRGCPAAANRGGRRGPAPAQEAALRPHQAEIRRYYEVVWQARRTGDVVLIKTLLYTCERVSELDPHPLRGRGPRRLPHAINQGKGGKDRVVPFPPGSKEPSPCT